jgi:beta-mannosidase
MNTPESILRNGRRHSRNLVRPAAWFVILFIVGRVVAGNALAQGLPEAVTLTSGWQLQDAAKVTEPGETISQTAYAPAGWHKATVPGTVLTSLVNEGVYPEPLYGENNRPDKIPESLCRTPYWYRTQFTVPASYAGDRVWLNFDGINYMAGVWVNGSKVGDIKGAFARGIFDVTSLVKPGETAAVAVEIMPPLTPGDPLEQTVANGLGPNGGVLTADGPTFTCSIGWDWMPAIRDRNIGIWQKVTLSASGPVVLKDPMVTSDLPLPKTNSADLTIETTVQNVTDQAQSGELRGEFGGITFQVPVTLAAGETKLLKFTPKELPQLHVKHPRLWWPNGFGEPNLYTLHLSVDLKGAASDERDVTFGIRKIQYTVPGSDFLTISVNGVPVFCKGGDWGMDEAMKREPRERMETQIRLHKEANYTMIRNWVGQSTSEDFYDLCDRYGIMVWDEFFQANASDGPNPNDVGLYLANVREKVLRFRNHPSIVIWCGRNESFPAPPALVAGIKQIMDELEPVRAYHANSNEGQGARSGGPYFWRAPAAFYDYATSGPRAEVFKTEIGCVSIPTVEAIQAMMPAADTGNFPNDDWAEHDLCKGNNHGDTYVNTLFARYGTPASGFNLPDFVRKAQMADYEAYRALYEGRMAKLLAGSTAVLTWMSNPAQPSTTWQIYSHDLEPFASFFATRKACEPVHVQMNQKDFHLMVINHTPKALKGLRVRVQVCNLDGTQKYDHTTRVSAPACAATDVGAIDFPSDLSAVHFVKVELHDRRGRLVSDNFYWRETTTNDLTALNTMPVATLDSKIVRHDADGKCLLDVTLSNTDKVPAVMAHIQLRRADSNQRVLPVFYSDNYVSLLPGESRTITVEAAAGDLGGQLPLVTLDGWNVSTASRTFPGMNGGAAIALNTAAQVAAK